MFEAIKQGLRHDRARFMTELFADIYYDVSLKSSHAVSHAVLDRDRVLRDLLAFLGRSRE